MTPFPQIFELFPEIVALNEHKGLGLSSHLSANNYTTRTTPQPNESKLLLSSQIFFMNEKKKRNSFVVFPSLLAQSSQTSC